MVVLKTKTGTIIRVSDGTQWTFPTPDVDGGASWRLRHTEWQPSTEERLMLASILDSYHELVYARNQKKRNLVAECIKEGMKAEALCATLAATGKAKECSDEAPRFCPMCNGRGVIPCTDPEGEDGRKRCDHCYGEGVITD